MPLIASCHCGATQIELSHPPTAAHECNCSYCSRTGAVWGSLRADEFKVLSNQGERTYSASGGLNLHHFCGDCGMQTWGDSPDWSSMYNDDGTPKPGFSADSVPTERSYAINLRLIDSLDWSAIDVAKMDGRNNW